ncbi:hypothetical protein I3843_01G126900 [Carya illinoinensis]|nr:hypothetical protein I3843_01G126900 [Carya illinoinensis]
MRNSISPISIFLLLVALSSIFPPLTRCSILPLNESDNMRGNMQANTHYDLCLSYLQPEPELERSLAYCAELYIQVVKYTLPQALDASIKGEYKFANYGIADAAKEAETCEKKFSGSTDSPVTDRNNLVENLSEVAKAIANVLLKG